MTTIEAAQAAGAITAHRPMLLGLAYRLRDRQAARETYVGPWLPEPVPTAPPSPFGPLDTVELREAVSTALLHLLERLTPPERAVYVLHTAFALPYAEIADLLDRSAADCRQLHHRAAARIADDRRRFTARPAEQRRLLDAFLAAACEGDLARLTDLVAADATAWTDGGGRVRAVRNPVHGRYRIARFFAGIYGRHRATLRAAPVELNGAPALLLRWPATARYTLAVAATDHRITAVYVVGNPDKLTRVPG